MFWLKEGDSNSRSFHTAASARKKKNCISLLKDANGDWKDWSNGLGKFMVDYFNSVFSSTGSEAQDILESVENRIFEEQNQPLIAHFDAKEVKDALFEMHPDKFPGLDGMIPAFYQ